MTFIEITAGIAAVLVAFLVFMLHGAHRVHKAVRKKPAVPGRVQVNRALTVTFVAVIGLLMLPFLAASATGELTAFDGRAGVLAVIALFTASYALIIVHSVLKE